MSIKRIDISAYIIPTDFLETTTIVVVEAHAGEQTGIGFTYGDLAAARIIDRVLSPVVLGRDPMAVGGSWTAMRHAVRHIGKPGIASMAISAMDTALWDLKARLLGLSLASLLGLVRDGTPVYGSGGFTSYTIDQLQQQLSAWVSAGIDKVKMKVGTQPVDDIARVHAARKAIGPQVELFVDANGAYARKQALHFAQAFAEEDVRWFEEPVSSDDLEGLRLLRDRSPAGMNIAAGEYGYDSVYFRRMLEAGAVDVLQADATRCAGISGFLEAAALAAAFNIPLSAHAAPSIHVHACSAVPAAYNIEYFHDHVRVERLLFDGVLEPVKGVLYPDRSRLGMGLEIKRADAGRFAA